MRLKRICHGRFQFSRAISPQFFIQGLEPVNQVGNVFARIHAPRRLAKMRTTTKGPMRIDGASPLLTQQRAGTFRVRFELFPPAGPHPLGGEHSLSKREKRSLSGETEMAALRAHLAVPLQRSLLQFCIDRLHLVKGGTQGWIRRFTRHRRLFWHDDLVIRLHLDIHRWIARTR